jgi:Cu/Zn superoxide dismutase
VHTLPCEFDAGGHYKIDPAVEDTVEGNEIWPAFTTDAAGVGLASVSVSHPVRGDALSVVVHDPATSGKLACADLRADDDGQVTASGSLVAFAAAEAADQAVGGTATLVRKVTSTEVSIELTGLDPAASYASHVHALPCGVANAGGHYKLDPTVADTQANNELWLSIDVQADGTASNLVVNDAHVARADAQSLVVHRVTADGAPKVACVDLARDRYPPLVTEGAGVLLGAGTERAAGLTATATMTRGLDGATTVSLTVSGAAAGAVYPAHVHALPCAIQNGGGHYKLDPGIADKVEANELWLGFTADANGAATAELAADHLACPEAQSIVIHDGADNAPLACIDLD